MIIDAVLSLGDPCCGLLTLGFVIGGCLWDSSEQQKKQKKVRNVKKKYCHLCSRLRNQPRPVGPVRLVFIDSKLKNSFLWDSTLLAVCPGQDSR